MDAMARGMDEKRPPRISIYRALVGEEGFTLAELLVVVGILIIFLIGVAGMLEAGSSSSATQYVLSRVEEDAMKVLNAMTRQIRLALTIDPFSTGDTIIFSGDLDGSGATSTMIFTALGGDLLRGPDFNSLQTWVEGVEGLAFTYYRYNPVTKALEVIDPGTSGWNLLVQRVDITIRFSRGAGRVTVRRDYTGSVTLRNNL